MTSSSVRRQRRQDRQGGVLVALGADRARERRAALDHELLGQRPSTRVGGRHAGGCPGRPPRAAPRTIRPDDRRPRPCPPRPPGSCSASTPERAAAPPRPRRRGLGARLRPRARRGRGARGATSPCCTTSTTSSTRRSTSTRRTARRSCASAGYPEWFVRAVLRHADHLHLHARDRPRAGALRVRRDLRVRARLRPGRPDGLATLEPRSVRKKLKQKSFAAGVNRDDVARAPRSSASTSTSTSSA